MADSATRKICAQVSDELVAVVPRLDDYTCPVCLSLAWLPVRLACQHVFCVRCVIKMQRDRKRQCPLCRQPVVLKADLGEWRIAPLFTLTFLLSVVSTVPMDRSADRAYVIDNLDNELVRFMERYFKKEAKEKQRANDIERGKEMFGESYKHTQCRIM
jgi:E3 ubiquitin-protein ligase BAH